MPNRDVASRARALGLKSPKNKENTKIYDEELEIIRQNYSKIGKQKTLELLNDWRRSNRLPERTAYALGGIARRVNVKAKRLNIHKVLCLETGQIFENALDAIKKPA